MNINRRSHPRRGWALLAAGALLATAACDIEEDIIRVEDPDVIFTVDDEALVSNLVNGAVREFYGGYAGFGGGDSYVSVSGLLADEITSAGTFGTRNDTDQRRQRPIEIGNTSDGTYINLQQARYQLGVASARVAEVEGTDDPQYGLTRALEGYAIQAMAEGFCSGLPLSEVTQGPENPEGYIYGSALETTELTALARDAFNDAIASGNSVELASLGLARAYLHEGEYDLAAAAVAGIPTEYVHKVPFSENAGTNTIFELQLNGRYTVSDSEGTNGQPFRAADDPRVQWTLTAFGFDRATFLYAATKYHNREAPLILASGVEARLVEAEAALNDGRPGDMITILNDLRADVDDIMFNFNSVYSRDFAGYDAFFTLANAIGGTGDLDPLVDAGTFEGNTDLLFQERAFWLYLTGQRLGDLRRLVRDYGRDPETVYPTGARLPAPQQRGGPYGTDVVMPVDFNEVNNPNYDIGSCSVSTVN